MRIFGLGPTELVIILVIVLFSIIPIWLLWKVFTRTGMSGAYALLVLIPYAGPLIALAVLAFARWPRVDSVPAAQAGYAPAGTFTPPPPAPPSVPQTPAGWLPDPTGEHRLRYWDGATWTDNVSD